MPLILTFWTNLVKHHVEIHVDNARQLMNALVNRHGHLKILNQICETVSPMNKALLTIYNQSLPFQI